MDGMNEYKETMGKRIQQARKNAHLTQMAFSEKINVSTQYISDLERGLVGCSVPTLLKICDALDISADYILKGQEPKKQEPEPQEPPTMMDWFAGLSPAEQELIEEGLKLLKKAFSLKDAKD